MFSLKEMMYAISQGPRMPGICQKKALAELVESTVLPSSLPSSSPVSVDLSVDLGLKVKMKVKDVWVIISMMVSCNANVITDYNRRRSGLPSAPLDMEYDSSSIEQLSSKHRHINPLVSDITYSPWWQKEDRYRQARCRGRSGRG